MLGSKNVYFQPPESLKLTYPCIVYSVEDIDTLKANDRNYRMINKYELTIIDRDPDTEIHYRILGNYQMCRFDRAFVSDNLYHKVLSLYY